MSVHDPTTAELAKILKRNPGVIAVHIVIDDGSVRAVHVLADARVNRSDVAAFVAATVENRTGSTIALRNVTVAKASSSQILYEEISELRSGFPSPVFQNGTDFVKSKLSSIVIDGKGGDLTARVTLQFGPALCRGEAESGGVHVDRTRMVADASLSAYEKYLRRFYTDDFGATCRLILKDMVPFYLPECRGFLSGVVLITEGEERQLAGSGLADAGDVEAAAAAACNAVDRYMTAWHDRREGEIDDGFARDDDRERPIGIEAVPLDGKNDGEKS